MTGRTETEEPRKTIHANLYLQSPMNQTILPLLCQWKILAIFIANFD